MLASNNHIHSNMSHYIKYTSLYCTHGRGFLDLHHNFEGWIYSSMLPFLDQISLEDEAEVVEGGLSAQSFGGSLFCSSHSSSLSPLGPITICLLPYSRSFLFRFLN